VAHRAGHGARQRRQRWFAAAQQPGVPHRATQNPPEDVAAALVRGVHTVGQEKRDRARMVGEHTVGRPARTTIVRPADDLHCLRASSSEWWTVTYSRSGSMPSHSLLVTHSQAYSIASFLK